MGVGDAILAGIGGGAAGMWDAQKFYHQEDLKRQLAELRTALTILQEHERTGRNDTTVGGRITTTGMQVEGAAQRTGMQQDGANYRTEISNDSRENIAGQRDATTRRGQDINEAEFWDGTMPAKWAGQDLTRYGINTTAATARRGQDIGASTQRYGIDTGAATSRRGQDVQQRGQDLSSSTSQRNADVRAANPFGNLFAPGATVNIDGSAAPTAPAPMPVQPRVQTPPRVAPAPGGAPGASAAPPAAAAPPAVKVGDVVNTRRGRIRVTAVHPDGSFDGEPVQ